MIPASDFGGRRAPYAPISGLEHFLERIRDRAVPEHVDQRFLQKLSIAANNEYSLLSALKFLGIIDDRGRPTTAYRQLQTTDRFVETLEHLVRTSYQSVFEVGAESSSSEELINFFRISSSPSQARNAARFFQAVCRLAAIKPDSVDARELKTPDDDSVDLSASASVADPPPLSSLMLEAPETNDSSTRLQTKARLLEKLPVPPATWSAQEYKEVCALFLEMLRSLDSE